MDEYKFSQLFAEWIAVNHFSLIDVSNGRHFWSSESFDNIKYSTSELLIFFLHEKE